MTSDAHPMHMNLVTFQVIGRTPFNVEAYEAAFERPTGVSGGIEESMTARKFRSFEKENPSP
jgi:hypothetical protein